MSPARRRILFVSLLTLALSLLLASYFQRQKLATTEIPGLEWAPLVPGVAVERLPIKLRRSDEGLALLHGPDGKIENWIVKNAGGVKPDSQHFAAGLLEVHDILVKLKMEKTVIVPFTEKRAGAWTIYIFPGDPEFIMRGILLSPDGRTALTFRFYIG